MWTCVSITFAPLAIKMIGSSPPASVEAAIVLEFIAFILAIGVPNFATAS